MHSWPSARGAAAAGGPIRNARLLAAAAEACDAARNAAAVALCGCARLRYRASKRWLGRIEKTLLHTRMCIFSVSLFFVICRAAPAAPWQLKRHGTKQPSVRVETTPSHDNITMRLKAVSVVLNTTSCPEIQSTVALEA